MTLPWSPVVLVDIMGSVLMLALSCLCAKHAWRLTRDKPDDIFRNYIYLFTLTILLFAVSRSFGHLVKQVLLLHDMEHLWQQIAPFSGAVNTTTFVVIFAFGISFHRFQMVHGEIEYYKNNLEELVVTRTKQLETSRITLQNILDNSNPINITSVDYDLVQANEAYFSIWPKPENNPSKIKCYESRPGENCHTANCPLRLIIEGSEEVIQEVTKEIDNETRTFIVTARPFRDLDGILIGMVESFQEITLRIKAENALKEMDRLKSEFISTAAHELNTPLSSILGYSEFLLAPENFGGFTKKQQEDFVNEIHQNAEALNRIIEDLLDISRIERGRPISMNKESIDIRALLKRMVKNYTSRDPKHFFQLNLPENPQHEKIEIDPHRVNQALENLISNAVKYSPEGKDITVSGIDSIKGWEIRVQDQGIGMSAEQLNRVFDKFYRADASETATQGLGLGMSIVKQIIEAHGGEIRLESEEGVGTTVILTLPCN